MASFSEYQRTLLGILLRASGGLRLQPQACHTRRRCRPSTRCRPSSPSTRAAVAGLPRSADVPGLRVVFASQLLAFATLKWRTGPEECSQRHPRLGRVALRASSSRETPREHGAEEQPVPSALGINRVHRRYPASVAAAPRSIGRRSGSHRLPIVRHRPARNTAPSTTSPKDAHVMQTAWLRCGDRICAGRETAGPHARTGPRNKRSASSAPPGYGSPPETQGCAGDRGKIPRLRL